MPAWHTYNLPASGASGADTNGFHGRRIKSHGSVRSAKARIGIGRGSATTRSKNRKGEFAPPLDARSPQVRLCEHIACGLNRKSRFADAVQGVEMAAAKIPQVTLTALAAIRDLGEVRLRDLIDRLQNLATAPPLKTSDLRRHLRDAVGDQAAVIAPQLLGLYAAKRANRFTPQQIVQNLTKDLSQIEESRWTEQQLRDWRQLEPLLEELFSVGAVETASKAVDLAYEYANLFHTARVVTDIRPVFDEEANRVTAAVISQTLRLYFSSEDGDHSLSVALDQQDLERLRDSCERAIRKARTAQNLIAACQLPSTIAGEPDEV